MKNFFIKILQEGQEIHRLFITSKSPRHCEEGQSHDEAISPEEIPSVVSLPRNDEFYDKSETSLASPPLEFLQFTATEDGIIVESIDGTTFHFAGGDVTEGLLTPGESIQIGDYTIICEETSSSPASFASVGDLPEEPPSVASLPRSETDSHCEEDQRSDEAIPFAEHSEPAFEITGLKFGDDEITNVKDNALTPMLILLDGKANNTSFNMLDKDQYIIGRSEDADVVIDDDNSSRHHAELFFEDGQFYIRDLESANGTFVNGQSISTHELASFDVIEIGGTKFKFILVNDENYEEPANIVPGLAHTGNVPQNFWATSYTKPKKSFRKISLYLLLSLLGFGLVQKYLVKPDSASIKTPTRTPVGNISEDQRNQIEAIYQRAVDFYSNRQYEEAIKEVNKVLEIIPDEERSLQLVQNAQYALKSIAAAKELQSEQIEGELVEDQTKFYLSIGIDYLQKEDYPKAEEAFLKVLEIDPGNSEAERRLKLVQSNLEPGDERGIASIDETEDFSAKAESLLAEGKKLFDEKDYRGAIEAWKGVLQLEGEDMLKFYAKAERSIDEAENFIEKKNAPLIDQARSNLQSGDFEEAKKYSKLLLEQDPTHAEAQEILGEVSFRLHQRAKTVFTEAVIDESLGYLDKAKIGFLKIIQSVDESDEYFDKAKDHLKKYPKE